MPLLLGVIDLRPDPSSLFASSWFFLFRRSKAHERKELWWAVDCGLTSLQQIVERRCHDDPILQEKSPELVST